MIHIVTEQFVFNIDSIYEPRHEYVNLIFNMRKQRRRSVHVTVQLMATGRGASVVQLRTLRRDVQVSNSTTVV